MNSVIRRIQARELSVLLSAIICCSVAETTRASILLVHDSSILGNGTTPQDGFNITRDTATGLDWLDLTLSTNRSFAAVTAQLGTGGNYQGFRVATDMEIGQLFLDVGAPSTNGSGVSFNTAAEFLVSAVGTTGVNSSGPFGYGFRNPNTAPAAHRAVSQYADYNPQPFVSVNAGYVSDVALAQYGTWLVRNTPAGGAVPEATPLVIWSVLTLCAAVTFGVRPRFGSVARAD